MNIIYCFTKWVPGALISSFLLLTACSSTPEQASGPAAEEPAEAVAPDQAIPAAELAPTDPDVMYHVFSAEVLGAEGDFSAAATEYLEAALLSNDPEIAERATRVAVSAGEWQLVALASDRWAMLDPTSLDARELAAGSRLREGDYVGAEFQLGKILELTSSDQARGWTVVIALLAPATDQVRANKVLENLLQDFDGTENVDALFARSQFAARSGELEQAVGFIDQAIALDPARADLLAWSGRLAVNMNNQELALERFRQAWQADREDPQVAMSYAELLKRNGDLDAGQAVLAQLPDSPDIRFARIVFALDGGDRETAELVYQGFAGDRYAGIEGAAFQAAQAAELLEYPRDAIDWYQQVTGEQSLRATMRQAFLLAQFGEIEKARNLVVQLRIQTDNGIRSQSYQAEAQILQDAGRGEEALQVLNDALANLPDDTGLRYMRALAAVGLGQLELAEADLRQIIVAEPDNAAAINALGYTFADLTERFDEAERLIFQAYELQPGDPSIIDSMGWISYRLGRLDEAESFLREAWAALRNAEIAAHLGEVLWVAGKQDEARDIWLQGVEIDEENEVLLKTLQRFGEMP